MSSTDYPEVPDVDPFAPEDGAAVLDAVDAFLARFVALPSPEARHAVALWVAHAHVLDAFETTPRLAFLSPEPGSGKTRALEIVELLVPRPVLTVNASPAYLIRRVADEQRPTVLFDEIDTVFGPKAKADNEDIRGLLNSGYRRGATSGRCVVRRNAVEVEEFPSFAAVALAGLDDLPDTIATRSVIVRMRRRAPDERVEPYRRRVHEREGHALRDELAAWVVSRYADLEDAWPELPGGVQDRDADVWEPLLAVADAAGGRWPHMARVAAVSMVSLSRKERGGLGIRLLEDVRTVFGHADYLGTDELLHALHDLEESPWGDLKGKPLDARGLSWRLGKYDVGPRQIKAINRKGYRRDDLHDAWQRYLPGVSVGEVETETTPRNPGPPSPGESETPETGETTAPPTCSECEEPLGPLDLAEGATRHAGCVPTSWAAAPAPAPPADDGPPCTVCCDPLTSDDVWGCRQTHLECEAAS